MKAQEFRVGNLFTGDNGKIFDWDYSCFDLCSKGIEVDEIGLPIPLTEEWLLKFGYDLITENYYAISGHLIWICNDLFICDKNGIILKHVHQLQNLYFALTGCELEIK